MHCGEVTLPVGRALGNRPVCGKCAADRILLVIDVFSSLFLGRKPKGASVRRDRLARWRRGPREAGGRR